MNPQQHAVGAPPGPPRPAHVLFLIDQLCGVGGAERAILQTIRLLPAHRFRSSLITFQMDRSIALFRDLPCEHYVFPLRRTYDRNALHVARKIRKFIGDQHVQIVHTFHETADLWGGLISRTRNSPALVSSRRDMGILRAPKHRLAYRLMRSRFDLILAVSDEVRRYCIEADGIDENRVVTLYNGLDMEAVARANGVATLRNEYDLRGRAPLIITVANIRRVKGIDVLLQTAAEVAGTFPNVLFLIVGAISDAEYFGSLQQQIAELGIERNVRFVGESDKVLSFLKMADVFFLPSRSEGFSNALIEAMACGLPCVATRVGGNAEAIHHGRSGFIVESEDARDSAQRIVELLNKPDMAKAMGAEGAGIVRQRFSSETMIKQLVAHYERLLAAKHNGVIGV